MKSKNERNSAASKQDKVQIKQLRRILSDLPVRWKKRKRGSLVVKATPQNSIIMAVVVESKKKQGIH